MRISLTLMTCCGTNRAPSSPLSAVYFDREAMQLAATNGHLAVLIPASEVLIDEVTGFIDVRAIQYAARHNKGVLAHLSEQTAVDGAMFPNPQIDSPFPDIQAIIPSPGGTELCLDAQLLLTLAQALYGRKSGPLRIKLRWLGYLSPVHVTPYNDDPLPGEPRAQGVLSPVADPAKRFRPKSSSVERACLAAIAEASARYTKGAADETPA